jgi:hypothetical protein
MDNTAEGSGLLGLLINLAVSSAQSPLGMPVDYLVIHLAFKV